MDYSGELFGACGVALLCSVCLMIIGKMAGSVGGALKIGGIVVIFGVLLSLLASNINELQNAFSVIPDTNGYFARSFSLMLKALGIAVAGRLCADICRDCGEHGIADGVEGVGRMAIFALCIPIISEILEYSAQVLGTGS